MNGRRSWLSAAAVVLLMATAAIAAAGSTAVPQLSAGSLRVLARGRTAAIQQTAAPATIVAGVRGAKVESEELYWKGMDRSPEKMIGEAEALESRDNFEDAMKMYKRIVVESSGGRITDRASIGWAVCQIRLGEVSSAIRRLKGVCARADDRDILFAATLPLALALDAAGERQDAVDALKKLVARFPDHPLAGQADGMIGFMTGQ